MDNFQISQQTDTDASDPKREEFKHQEALLLLEVMRAKSAVCQSERNLAQMQLDESTTRGTLYKYRVAEMQRRFNMAESHIGSIRNSIQTNRGILCEGSLHKCHRCQASISSINIDQDSGTCSIKNHSVLNLTVSPHTDHVSPEV